MPGFAYPRDPYRVILCYVIVDTLGQQTDLGPVHAFVPSCASLSLFLHSLEPKPMSVKSGRSESRMASRTRPPVRIIFAAVLKELMRQRGWTQRDLSMASGISERQISNLVKGTQSAALDTAEAIAQAFDMQTWHMLIRTTGLPPKDLARLRRVIAAFLDGYQR